jgi:hypothetical protein
MLQRDPALRPTAAIVLDVSSKHRVVTELQVIQSLPVGSPQISPPEVLEPEIGMSAEPPTFRRVRGSDLTDPKGGTWIVIFAMVNVNNTRLLSESVCFFPLIARIILWNSISGNRIWQRECQSSSRSGAYPTFSTDGKFFGLHLRSNVVEIFDAEFGRLFDTVDMSEMVSSVGQVAAIAIGGAGARRRIGVALEGGGDLTISSVGYLNTREVRSTLGCIVDVFVTHGMTHVSIGYDSRVWFLFIIGRSATRTLSGAYMMDGFYADTQVGAAPKRLFPDSHFPMTRWSTPVYTLPSTGRNFNVFRSHDDISSKYGSFFNSSGLYVCITSDLNAIYGISPDGGVLVVSDGDEIAVLKEEAWIKKEIVVMKDQTDDTEYKYLSKFDGTPDTEAETELAVAARIIWDNDMPGLTAVKAFAKTERSLTLILEGERIVVFEKV